MQPHNDNIAGWHADRGIDEHRQIDRGQMFGQLRRQLMTADRIDAGNTGERAGDDGTYPVVASQRIAVADDQRGASSGKRSWLLRGRLQAGARGSQRLCQIADDIVDVLDAYRQTYIPRGHAGGELLGRGQL